jgi:hypothetical protein
MVSGENLLSCVGFYVDHGRLEWQHTSQDLEKAPDVAYEDALRGFNKVWCVQGLIVTHNILVVTWKVRPWMGIIS